MTPHFVRGTYVLDSGPLIAYLVSTDLHHEWAVSLFAKLPVQVVTCEGVLVEAAHHVAKAGVPRQTVNLFVERGAVVVWPVVSSTQHAKSLSERLGRYADVPMDYVDACVMHLYEAIEDACVVTVDDDFFVYRAGKRRKVAVEHPAGRF